MEQTWPLQDRYLTPGIDYHNAYVKTGRNSAAVTFAKGMQEAPPQSPQTDSTSSSQDSPVIEHLESAWARGTTSRNFKCGSKTGTNGLDSTAATSPLSFDRSALSGLHGTFAELPSPSGNFQDRLRANSRVYRQSNKNTCLPDQHKFTTRARNCSYRHLFEQVTRVGSGQSLTDIGFPEAALTVEHLVSVVKGLQPSQPVVNAVAHGLLYMDSRAVAALLKDVAKSGVPHRAIEIFDWLRGLPSTHELAHLCDVYTYTTVIALCGQRQSLRLALELVAEMRGRGIPCNVHTYSALMNTCIKCGELELALDVFKQLRVEKCVPNVVTFNTLVDVYGKLGQWQDAINVLDEVYLAGLEPEPRTFNTVIIAANICNQPLAALKVYERMLTSGFKPTDTTYTAVISAFGKAGQLDNAMKFFKQMVQQGFERNIITYGSLISACEKAGKWKLALELADEMRRDHVSLNTMTFNSLLNACAQGGQSQKAEALFHSMLSRRCRPDASAYNAVLLAHIRAGHWRAALQAFRVLQQASMRPEPWLYTSLVHCLWESGIPQAQNQAVNLFSVGCRSSLIPNTLQQTNGEGRILEVTITAPNTSVAALSLIKWLRDTRVRLEQNGASSIGNSVVINVGKSQGIDAGLITDEASFMLELRSSLSSLLDGMNSPFRSDDSSNWKANSLEISQWLQDDATHSFLSDYVPASKSGTDTESRGAAEMLGLRIAAQEAAAIAQAADTHTVFCQVVICTELCWTSEGEEDRRCRIRNNMQAESHQEAKMKAAEPLYGGSREECMHLANELAKRFSVPQEIVYCAMMLLDSSLVAGLSFPLGHLIAACLTIAAQSCGCRKLSLQSSEAVEAALTMPEGSLLPIIEHMYVSGIPDSAVASPLAALENYLSYLTQEISAESANFDVPLSPRTKARVIGASKHILLNSMAEGSTRLVRPSLMAAAALALDRKARGYLPLWPAALSKWTGLNSLLDPELAAAMEMVATYAPS